MKLSEGLRKGLAIKEKIGRPYCAAVIVAAGTSSRMGGTNIVSGNEFLHLALPPFG